MKSLDELFWLPYAWGEINEVGEMCEKCPECGKLCVSRHDEVGEAILRTYPDHYAREHSDSG